MNHDEPKFSWREFLYLPCTMAGRERRKFAILVALESLIWHSLVLLQHQIQLYKQNLTNSNYVYRYFSITYMFDHILKQLFLTFISEGKKIGKQLRIYTKKQNSGFYRKRIIYVKGRKISKSR